MKLSISAVSKLSEISQKPYFPIVIYLESEEDISIDSSRWSPSCFPFREKSSKNSAKDVLARHREKAEELLSSAKEIGGYYLGDKALSLDRELLFHYLVSGCKISKAFKRLLQKLEYDLTGIEKQRLSNLLELEGSEAFEVKNSSDILEMSERLKAFSTQ